MTFGTSVIAETILISMPLIVVSFQDPIEMRRILWAITAVGVAIQLSIVVISQRKRSTKWNSMAASINQRISEMIQIGKITAEEAINFSDTLINVSGSIQNFMLVRPGDWAKLQYGVMQSEDRRPTMCAVALVIAVWKLYEPETPSACDDPSNDRKHSDFHGVRKTTKLAISRFKEARRLYLTCVRKQEPASTQDEQTQQAYDQLAASYATAVEPLISTVMQFVSPEHNRAQLSILMEAWEGILHPGFGLTDDDLKALFMPMLLTVDKSAASGDINGLSRFIGINMSKDTTELDENSSAAKLSDDIALARLKLLDDLAAIFSSSEIPDHKTMLIVEPIPDSIKPNEEKSNTLRETHSFSSYDAVKMTEIYDTANWAGISDWYLSPGTAFKGLNRRNLAMLTMSPPFLLAIGISPTIGVCILSGLSWVIAIKAQMSLWDELHPTTTTISALQGIESRLAENVAITDMIAQKKMQ
jgi:hypothetical protein